MEMIEDYTKRLSRPIKDLDDVRQAMASLKEVRENEIFIDSSLDPIEVRVQLSQYSVPCTHDHMNLSCSLYYYCANYRSPMA